ncbi:MAG: Nickel import ATP-binding protein NikO [bacterium ADurb.Bin236]|nr:MAG: Nickel import ATP-binding protein NikO [bacterium ADurb.Bin236]HOY62237.1 ATP-binding cassette domain-containing protein [bacterium]HPN95149.1 ATP-binding cassette domain-containing protein [bacterium]
MTQTRAAFRLENFAAGYDGRPVVEIESLDIPKGGRVALLGANGAGKTTLLRALNGFVKPIRGRVFFDDSPMDSPSAVSAARRRMTYISQTPFLFNCSARANVAYGLRSRGVPAREALERADALLERAGLSKLARRNARSLSGGEAQLTALTRALIIKPEALLLDEPTGNVDAANTEMIEALILDASKSQGATIVFSTHNVEQARRLADSAVSINLGSASAHSL